MIIGVSFLFPSYSNNKFLELAISKVIDMVDKFVLFINEEARSGIRARNEDVTKIIEIANKFDKVFLEFCDTNDEKNYMNMHEQYYVKKAFDLVPKASVVWMVHPDEIYDEENKQKVQGYIEGDDTKILRFWSQSYYNTPHWKGVPEKYPSRRLWRKGWDDPGNEYIPFSPEIELGKNEKVVDIFFHHPSYVNTHEELNFKLNNSSHAIQKQINPFFADKLDSLKTDKNLVHLHPVNPEETDHVEWVDGPINREMMRVFFKYLIDNSPYEYFKGIFDDCKNYLMTDIERRALSGIVSEMLPRGARILEVGTWLGGSSVNMAMSNPTSQIWTIDHYKLDTDMRWWGEQAKSLDDYYKTALGFFNKYGLYPHRISLLKGGFKDIVPYLPNDFFDFIFLDGSHDYRGTKDALIEVWPKVKNFGFIGFHDTLLEEVSLVFTRYTQRDHTIKAPWGLQKLDYYEVYNNVIDTNVKVKTTGIGLVRVKK